MPWCKHGKETDPQFPLSRKSVPFRPHRGIEDGAGMGFPNLMSNDEFRGLRGLSTVFVNLSQARLGD